MMAWYGPRGNCGCCGVCPKTTCNPHGTLVESVRVEVELDDVLHMITDPGAIYDRELTVSGLSGANGTYDIPYDPVELAWKFPVVPLTVVREADDLEEYPYLIPWYYSVFHGTFVFPGGVLYQYLPFGQFDIFRYAQFEANWHSLDCTGLDSVIDCTGDLAEPGVDIIQCMFIQPYTSPGSSAWVPGAGNNAQQNWWPTCWQWTISGINWANIRNDVNGTPWAYGDWGCLHPDKDEKELIITDPVLETEWRAWHRLTVTRAAP